MEGENGRESICIDPVSCLCLAPDSLIHLMDLFPSGPLAPDLIPDHLCAIVRQRYHLPLIMPTYTTLLAARVLVS